MEAVPNKLKKAKKKKKRKKAGRARKTIRKNAKEMNSNEKRGCCFFL